MAMTRFLRIFKEANFLSLTANTSIAIFGFAGFALLARSFPAGEFGQWVLYVSSATFVDMFRFGVTNTAIIRYLSGVDRRERRMFMGSNALIGLVVTTAITIILVTCRFIFPEGIDRAGYHLFFSWYPLLAFINLPMNTALVVMQADQKFGKILLIRSISSGGLFLVILTGYFFIRMELVHLVIAQIALNVITSLFCMYHAWDGLRHLRRATAKTNRMLLDFGKYTTFTLIGTNLLRSADTLIISLSPLGTAAVALYSIPLKLTELQQIPLRSFVATAFPKMSKASIRKNLDEVKSIFYTYSGALFYLFIPFSLLTFIFADFLVLTLGGAQYLTDDPVTGSNAVLIMRIFSIYGLLLPVDRMTGVGLDSINLPDKNFIKVLIMVIFNIAGDLIAIFLFRSLELVAAGSVLFTLIGLLAGFYFFDQSVKLEGKQIFTSGLEFYRDMLKKIRVR